MISPRELRAQGCTDDEIIGGIQSRFRVTREKAISWMAALDRGEQPWVDLVEATADTAEDRGEHD